MTTEEEKTIDNRVRAINEAQRTKEYIDIIQTMLYTISPEYKETQRQPLTIAKHPKFKNYRPGR